MTHRDEDKPATGADTDHDHDATEGKGPQAEPATERGRQDNEQLHEPAQDQVLARDQVSQVNDPNLKR